MVHLVGQVSASGRSGLGPVVPVVAALALMLSIVVAQQEQVTVLRASASAETSSQFLKLEQMLEDRVSKPSNVIIRRVSNTAAAQADLLATGSLVDFGVGAAPLTTSQQVALAGGGLNIPFAVHSVSLFVNIPENAGALNITACTAAKMFSGAITSWSAPEFKDSNPGLLLTVNSAPTIVVQTLAASNPATIMLMAWLSAASASCTGGPLWTASSTFPATALLSTNMTGDIMRTPYSLGYTLTTQGVSSSLNELAVQNKAGAFMLARATNITNVVSALTAQLPATYDLPMTSVNTINMDGSNVFPLLALDYMYLAKNWSTKEEKGALMQAFATLALTKDGQALLSGTTGIWGVGATSAIALAVNTTLATMTLGAGITTYTLEAKGTSGSALAAVTGSLSGDRVASASQSITDLQAQIDTLNARLARAGTRVLRGSGSSAMTLVFWKLMESFRGMSSSPVWMTYRAVGSGTGEREIMGQASQGYQPFTHFGASDVSMSSSSFNALKTAGVTVVHIPICVAPMSFFVNFPATYITQLGGAVKLSACTLAKIFSGAVTSWSAAEIAADNGGAVLPDLPIKFMYRSGTSGTTAVITQYLTQATSNQGCPSAWALGSANTVPGWTSLGNAVGTVSTVALAKALVNATWSIGYMEAGIGRDYPVLQEVSVKNRAGAYVTSSQADVPAAASALFQTNAWPSTPTADFSSVSIIDQPGANTWPIASLPMMFVRTDITASGDSGALLVAFLRYLTNKDTQASLTSLGLYPLPADVLAYTVTRALPLLLPDLRSQKWLYELSTNAFNGAGENVFSDPALSSTYNYYSVGTLQTAVASATAKLSQTQGVNQSAIDLASSSSQATGALAEQLQSMENKIATLQSVAIAGMAFGIVGLLVSIFASCRVFVTATTVSPLRVSQSVRGSKSGMDMDLMLKKDSEAGMTA